MASFESNVASFWAPGTKLCVEPGGKTVTVAGDGGVSVSGLEEYVQYRLVGEGRAVAFTAKSDETRSLGALERSRRETARLTEQTSRKRETGPLPSAAPGRSVTPNVTTGARSSVDVKARHQEALTGLLEEGRKVEADPQPHPNQVDVGGVPQRSDTPFGQATPKDKGEDVPAQSQDDAKGPQRSDTEEGTAAPKVKSERVPGLRQEDAPKGLRQSSATPDGEATPREAQRPGVKAAVEAEKARESSDRKVGSGKPSAQKTGKAKAKPKKR